MSWYKIKVGLKYNKAIFAEDDNNTFLLIKDNLTSTHDWFNIKKGAWNSSHEWLDPADAVKCYVNYGYRVYNGNLTAIEEGK